MSGAGANGGAPRLMVWDIETSPNIGLYFGKPWDVNIAKTVQQSYVFGFAWKWVGEKQVHTCYIWDFPLYQSDPTNDVEVLKKWSELITSADAHIGHNSDQFDFKEMYGRLVDHDLPPVPKPLSIDTKKAAKQIGNYQSNKLDDLGERYHIGRKQTHEGIELWWKCMNGDLKAQRKMVSYNKQDVRVTEALYLKVRPYMFTHPNIANLSDRPSACPVCGDPDAKFYSKGFKRTKTGRYRRFTCQSCGANVSQRTQEKGDRPQYV